MRIALIMEYDGTRYYGSQLQDNVPTIQGELEKAIMAVTGEEIRTAFAGRTDRGVHAKGQVVAFHTSSSLPVETVVRALNHYLPDDIIATDAFSVRDDFDPRRDAISREYCYYVWNDKTPSAFSRLNSYFVPQTLEVTSMNEACQFLLGTHDFISFTSSIDGMKNTVRTVYKANIFRFGAMVIFHIVANAFLPHQVLHTMGALLRVGFKKINVPEFYQILQLKKLASAGPAVPPHGLWLMKVNYAGDAQ